MPKTSCEIAFELVDLTARDDGALSGFAKQEFVDFNQLHTDSRIEKYGTCEINELVLDGTMLLFPGEPEAKHMGFWSAERTQSDCIFARPQRLEVQFTGPHTSNGITLVFSEETDGYCASLEIKWYAENGSLITSQVYTPNQAYYFCKKQVEDYFKIGIDFYATNLPGRYLKLSNIYYGEIKLIGDKQLISAELYEEVSVLSDTVSINTLNFTFYSGDDFSLMNPENEYPSLQLRQQAKPTGIIAGKRISLGAYYLDEPANDTGGTTTMSCIDIMGILDSTDYMGGLWLEGIAANDLMLGIMTSAGMPKAYEIDDALQGLIVTGYLPICTHREAVQQLAFAIGAIVNCARSDRVRLYPAPETPGATIGLDRKVVGHSAKQRELVTGVEVYVHKYKQDSFTTVELFSGMCSPGVQEIYFNAPHGTLRVTGTGVTIKENGVNYAILQVTAETTVRLTGYEYKSQSALAARTEIARLPASEKANVLTIDTCTLDCDAQALADRIYRYYQNRITDEGDILPGHEYAGEMVRLESDAGLALEGIIESASTNLVNGLITTTKITGKTTL